MRSDLREPCKSCPYRRDAPLGLWHRSEFENLLAHDANELHGAMFGCHKDRERPPEERRFCVGWLLDQKRRGLPSIQLRLQLRVGGDEALARALDEITDGGNELYPSVRAMCLANGVRLARLKTPRQQSPDEGS
jgi:uncharacterized protein DUF6283